MKLKKTTLNLIITTIFLQGCTVIKPATSTKPTIQNKPIELVKETVGINLGTNPIFESELDLVLNTALKTDQTYLDSLSKEFINTKLFSIEARQLGYDKEVLFEEEIKNYSELIADEYFFDDKEYEALKNEALEHIKYEVNASHIFIGCTEFASPRDTLKAFERIEKINNQLLNLGGFENLAKEFSEDSKTNFKGGNMGWFSSLQLIYPLEKAIYNTPQGKTSGIIRTPLGYHIIKVNDKRPNSGTVTVKTITKIVDSESKSDSLKAVLTSVYNKLKLGNNFDQLADQYSDDQYSKLDHGLLPTFSIGSREEEAFEEAAFKLSEGEFSFPVRSKNGWHIIKLIKKEPFKVTDELVKTINSKVKSHSRGDELAKRTVNKLKNEQNYKTDGDGLKEAIGMLSSKIVSQEWNYNSGEIKHTEIAYLNNHGVPTNEFLRYILKNQVQYQNTEKLEEFGYRMFNDFSNNIVKENGLKRLAETNLEYKGLMNIFADEILAKKFVDKNITSKIMGDSLTLRNFYNNNQSLFSGEPIADITIMSFKDNQVQREFNDLKTSNPPYPLRRGIKPIFYQKNTTNLIEADKIRLFGLIKLLNENPNLIVEVGGHQDLNELDGISNDRMKNVVQFLLNHGIDLTRIREFNFQKSKLADRFDWVKNQRTTFEFYSNSEIDLMKLINRKHDQGIQMKTGQVAESSLYSFGDFQWKTGKQYGIINGRIVELEISNIDNSKIRQFKDVEGKVVLEYQKTLKEQLLKELHVKYPTKIINQKYAIFNK